MFGIGLPEMIVILALALVLVGPEKLPELARSLAKGVNELKNIMNQLKESLNEEREVISSVQDDLTETAGQMQKNLLDEGTVEIESSEERPWERDAATAPEEDKEAADQESAASQSEQKHFADAAEDFQDNPDVETSCIGKPRNHPTA